MRETANIGKSAVVTQESTAAHDPAANLPDDFYEQIKPQLYRRIGKELKGDQRVLDVGCGGCELSRFLAETYSQDVIGVDIADGSFPDRDELKSRTGILLSCVKADARRLGFLAAGTIDAVVMVWALHELEKARAVLVEARRALRPGGTMLIVDFPRGSLAQRLWNEDYYTPHQVSDLLAAAGYADISVRLVERRQLLWAKGFRPGRKEPTS